VPPSDPADVAAAVGLCAGCRHARVQRSERGSAFWRCARAATDPRFARYPALPVRACPGCEPVERAVSPGRDPG
jgi:hypothetical protein